MSAARQIETAHDVRKPRLKIAEQALIARLKTGDPKAVEILYDNYSAAIFGIISRIVRFDEVAEDILQDTFVKVWRCMDGYDESKGRFFTWLAWVARHTALDYLRKKSTRNEQLTDRVQDSAECLRVVYRADRNPDTIGIRRMADELHPKYREILDLIYFKGYTHVEVAETMCIPLGTVKTRLTMALKQLRSRFNQ